MIPELSFFRVVQLIQLLVLLHCKANSVYLKNKKGRLGVLFRVYYLMLAIANVHCNFETKTHFSRSWFCPHGKSPKVI